MSIRVRPAPRPTTRPRRRDHWQREERTQFWVTIGFIALIALALLFLLGSVAVGYYNEHFKAVGNVQGAQITRDQVRERVALNQFRLTRTEGQVRQAAAAGEIDEQTMTTRLAALQQAVQTTESAVLPELVDLQFQGQLAGQQGLSVSDAEVDAAQRKEASGPAQRRVQAIFVAPEKASPASKPTPEQQQAAENKANQALAELRSGKPFGDVARTYSSDPSKDKGGEYGLVSQLSGLDDAWRKALFAADLNGTTDVVLGQDGTYRIGRVTEIVAGPDDPNFTTDLQRSVSLDAYRRNLRSELLAQKLQDKIVADTVSGDVDQVHLSDLFIAASAPTQEGATEADEVRVAHILYSPADNPSDSGTLPADDPRWEQERQRAEATANKLKAITDVAARTAEFKQIARSESEDTGSGEQGGELGYSQPASGLDPEFAKAIFEGEHNPGDMIGPVKSAFGWHVILYERKRKSHDDVVNQVQGALDAPNADFAALARQYSDGPEAEAGGDLGWKVRQELETNVADLVFGLQPGAVGAPLTDSTGTHYYKVTERAKRPLNAQQRATIESTAFRDWYDPQLQTAKDEGRVTEDPDALAGAQEPGSNTAPDLVDSGGGAPLDVPTNNTQP